MKNSKNNKCRRLRNRLGSALIIIGSICIVYFCWINYSGRVFQAIYLKYYESRVEEYGQDVAENQDFFAYGDLPDFLTAGQDILPSNASPVAGVEGEPASTQAGDTAGQGMDSSKSDDAWTPINYTDRADYVEGDMTLIVNKMGVNTKVIDGVSLDQLKKGPGMYNESDLPMNNGTVIIAAHRDVYGAWFYNIDKLTTGDRMVLELGNKVYTYEYESTVIVEKTDWSAVQKKNYGALILTSCTPKGTSAKRIIVTGQLISISDREQS